MSERDIVKQEKPDALPREGQPIWLPPGYELAVEAVPRNNVPHLWDYIRVVWHRRWLVALVALFCVSVTTIAVLRATPIFEAKAKLRIEADVPRILSFDEDTFAPVTDWKTDIIDTQVQIIQNRILARQVVEQLNLFADKEDGQEPRAAKSPIAGFLAYLKSLVAAAEQVDVPQDPEEIAAAKLRGRVTGFLDSLSVERIRDSQIVEVKFLADDRKVAADAVNALCDAYIRWSYESRLNAGKYAKEWLEQKLDDLKAKLEQSEEKLYEFAGGKDILPLQDSTQEISKQLNETGRKLAEAERTLFEKQFELRALESTTGSQTALPNHPRMEKLASDLAAVEVKLSEAKVQFGPDLPEVMALETTKQRLEQLIEDERNLALENARLECSKARETCDFLKQSYDQQGKRIVELQQRLIQYNILKREIDVNKELYNALLQRSRELTVASGMKAGNVTIVEPAEAPAGAKYPRKKRSVLLGGVLGLFLGIGLAFFLEYMDTTVKSPEEIRQIAQLATLAALPHHSNSRRSLTDAPVERITRERPDSALSESIRSLRTAVMYSLAAHSPRTILVTSAFPAEGKTTVAINLAIAFAQRGQKTLLIDADLKRPGVEAFFDLDRNAGLTDVLTGRIGGSVIQNTEIDNLCVLPSGPRAPNPVDLLDSSMMRDLLAHFAEQFDHIVIDSAPLFGMTDTEVLAPYVDGVILVIRPGRTPRAAVRRMKEKVVAVQGRILGVVFNNPTPSRKHPYGYGYPYDYGYSYSLGLYGEKEDPADQGPEELVEGKRSSGFLSPPGH